MNWLMLAIACGIICGRMLRWRIAIPYGIAGLRPATLSLHAICARGKELFKLNNRPLAQAPGRMNA
jgi:hypothetical protein